jgi:hypothetical protein
MVWILYSAPIPIAECEQTWAPEAVAGSKLSAPKVELTLHRGAANHILNERQPGRFLSRVDSSFFRNFFGGLNLRPWVVATHQTSVPDDELRGPIEAMTVSMRLQQSVRTKLKEMASVLESEVPDDFFQGVQMLEANAGCTFASFLRTECFFSIHVSISCSSLTIEPLASNIPLPLLRSIAERGGNRTRHQLNGVLTPKYEVLFKKNEKSNAISIGGRSLAFAIAAAKHNLRLILSRFLSW